MVYTFLILLLSLLPYISASPMEQSNDVKKQSSFTSFLLAISMILVSEIGDKTFLIAALMAMKHNKYTVFLASISSLAIMTLLSGIFGQAFTSFFPETLISWLASILFFIFGFKILKEAMEMDSDMGVEDELHEVEQDINNNDLNNSNNLMESGGVLKSQKNTNFFKFTNVVKDKINHLFSPLFIQVFVMVFLGEIGDRSQISTVVMAGSGNLWPVILGSILGHSFCSAIAVIFGVLLASRIKMKTVTLIGGALFIIFGFVYAYEALS
ncbi:related to GCR1-dependent translation factor 1 [Hanseniaspora guilliermondii]|uniref:GDT1 family protein n=1 Tax=Hanseniaspora guilliermondii TaxID=56406 RepID=A0A1L0D312_9ASCO|nr:related to GCR1-dependent translation factor 1 [Hanseniaspora guilliermondii]